MDHPEPTIADVVDLLKIVNERLGSVEKRLGSVEKRLGSVEQKVDDLAAVVQGMATGHAKRFDAIEKRLDGRPPLELV
ncbi:MAG: hypothetical protein OXQ31_10865 [Spirochaetaceae bacterium]|nr:hypothetical protein [Spirochaetaceae bacterium]